MFSDQNGIKLEIDNGKGRKSLNIWKLNKTLHGQRNFQGK